MTSLRRVDAFGEWADEAYALLIEAHRGLSDEESSALNARLVLLLANHVGQIEVLREALEAARRVSPPADPG